MAVKDGQNYDPYCLFHGIRLSQHKGGRCLYCCLCFKVLTEDECSFKRDGTRQDVCVSCAEKEDSVILDLARKYQELIRRQK